MKKIITLLLCCSFLSAHAQRAKAVILIYLDGGPAQTDTFDPKPDQNRDIKGPYDSIQSTLSQEITLGQRMIKLAKHADKFSLIRSMTHGSNAHETGHYQMTTGDMSKGDLVYPSYGAVINYHITPEYTGILPPYISLTSANSRFNEGGFLGNEYKSFDTGGSPEAKEFKVEGIMNNWTNAKKLTQRMKLLEQLEKRPIKREQLDSLRERNKELILGDARNAFNLSDEPLELRQAYGMNRLGQSCLAARRLVQAGVRFVNVRTTGWDTHKKHFQYMGQKLPQLDQALATLLDDLQKQHLLDSTIVLCGGEFGRSPMILWEAPWNGGRAHFGKAFSYLVAGGGFIPGKTLGKTSPNGEKVIERPVYPADLIGTVYSLLGIDPWGSLPHPTLVQVPMLPSLGKEGQSAGILTELIDIDNPFPKHP